MLTVPDIPEELEVSTRRSDVTTTDESVSKAAGLENILKAI
jgi:hypothetical protein